MGVVASAREPREDRVKRHAPKKKAKEKARRTGARGEETTSSVRTWRWTTTKTTTRRRPRSARPPDSPREADAVSPGTGRLAMVG